MSYRAGGVRNATAFALDSYAFGMLSAAAILSLGESPSAFGQTLALLITFLGIGVIVNILIAYVVFQVLAERKQNQERQQGFEN